MSALLLASGVATPPHPSISFDPSLPVGVVLVVGALLLTFTGWQLRRTPGRAGTLRWAVRMLMVVLALVIVMRPIIPVENRPPVATGGLEVYFAVDTTTSMAAEDVGGTVTESAVGGSAPGGFAGGDQVTRPATRLDGVRADIEQLATLLAGAQFSLTTFDAAAVQRVPLTSDRSALISASRALTPEISGYSRGSSIDEALPLLTRILRDAKSEHPTAKRVLFYFGDGEQTRADRSPDSFAPLAPYLSGGAVLGYGTTSGGPMRINVGPSPDIAPESGPFPVPYVADPTTGTLAISKIDEVALGTIASQLSVAYFHREAGVPVTAATSGIEVGAVSSGTVDAAAPGELYWIPAILFSALLMLELLRALIVLTSSRNRPREDAA